jgi:hypothetical protein
MNGRSKVVALISIALIGAGAGCELLVTFPASDIDSGTPDGFTSPETSSDASDAPAMDAPSTDAPSGDVDASDTANDGDSEADAQDAEPDGIADSSQDALSDSGAPKRDAQDETSRDAPNETGDATGQ